MRNWIYAFWLLSACAGAGEGGDGDATPTGDGDRPAPMDAAFDATGLEPDATEGPGADAAETPDAAPPDAEVAVDGAPPSADGAPPPPADAAPPPPDPALDCYYPSEDFDAPLVEYDVMGRDQRRLRFVVPGLPPADRVDRALLVFDTYDADHPGAEGRIWVNGNGPYDIPADAANDNQPDSAEVDVTGATVAGENVIEFGSSLTEPRTFYRIGRVALNVAARVDACAAPPEPPPPQAVERTVHYRQAEYTRRNNWVVRCNDYAFTARGDEHLGDDCDRAYAPDGSRRGTAVFRFPAVVEATYEIVIRSRHTANRNPSGALFIVNGEERRISQRSDRDRTDDVWGRRRLSGDVNVVLDSSREGESDSVIHVRLRPVGP